MASSRQVHILSGKRIIVSGAGLAGLSFVIALRKHLRSVDPSSLVHPPTLVIYERESKELAPGREGYSISIRSDGRPGGIQTLQKLGILDKAIDVSITGLTHGEAGGFTIWDTSWNELLKIRPWIPEGLPVGGLRIARRRLRDVMIDAVEAGDVVHWNIACTGVTRLDDGRVQLQLSNGGTDQCDLLIAADGASSKLRACLRPEDKLSFAGPVFLGGTARFLDGPTPKPVDQDWGPVLGGEGKGLFVSPVDKTSALWGLSYLASEPREPMKQPMSKEESDKICQEALQLGSCFQEPFQTLVRATDPTTTMVFNAMDKQPFANVGAGYRDDKSPAVFIGDSNHAVSPFAGNGANLAMVIISILYLR